MSLTTSDAGTCLMIRGETQEEVEAALRAREAQGYRRQGPPAQVGKAWIATCTKPGAAGATHEACRVERLGGNVFITGPSEDAVRQTVAHLATGGAKLIGPVEKVGDQWSAVCDAPR